MALNSELNLHSKNCEITIFIFVFIIRWMVDIIRWLTVDLYCNIHDGKMLEFNSQHEILGRTFLKLTIPKFTLNILLFGWRYSSSRSAALLLSQLRVLFNIQTSHFFIPAPAPGGLMHILWGRVAPSVFFLSYYFLVSYNTSVFEQRICVAWIFNWCQRLFIFLSR